jgi:type I restriction enzyme S subunit
MTWDLVSLDKICVMLSGNAWSASKFKDSGKTPIIRIQNLGNNENEKFIWWDESYDEKFIVKKGDILLSLSGSIKVDVWKDRDALLNQRIVKLIPNKDIDHKWFFWQITNIILDIERMGKWALVNNVSITDLKELQIPLPPFATQKRIAEILDAADALRRKDQELLKKYDELAQVIFIDMFGDPVKNEKGWDLKTIDEVAIKVTDGDHLTPIRSQRGYKLLSCRNVKNGYIDFEAGLDFVEEDEFNRMYKRCNPEKGDILVSCSGTIGRVTQIKIDEKFVLVRSAALIKPDYRFIVSTYFEYYLQTDFMQREMYKSSNTSSQANLFTGPIKALPVLLPSKNLQEKFAAKIQLLEKAKNMALSNNISTSNLFDSLIQKAFKGELVA